MSNQTKNNNLNYLIDPTFTNVNRLSALTFENEDDRTSFSKYYTTGSLLDYEYFKHYHKLIAIDLSKQIKLENPDLKQQINFFGRLFHKIL